MIKKKNGNIYWCHPHFLNWLGGSKYIFEIATRLSKKYDITIVADVFSKESRKKFRSAGIKTRTLSGFSTNNYFYWILLPLFLLADWKKLRKIVTADDILVTSMFPMNVLAFLLKTKHIQICFEPYAFFYDSNFISGFPETQKILIGIANFFYSWLDRKATKKANFVLTLSNFNKEWIRKIYGVKAGVIYEGVDIKFFRSSSRASVSKKYRNTKIIFHSTDFTKIKGTEYLFKAMPYVKRRIGNVKLLITSTLENKKERKILENFAGKNGFLENVEFLGFLDYKLLPVYLTLADVVVQPSFGQSMNLTIKEAMSCGTAVITCLEGKEQFEDGTSGYLLNPRQSALLSDRIVQLLKDDELSKKMGIKGRKIIENKFFWNAVYRKINRVLKGVVNQQ